MPTGGEHDPARDMIATNSEILPIRGLLYFPNFLTAEEEHFLLEQLDSNRYSAIISRRQQFYGETYYHTTHNLPQIQPKVGEESAGVSEQALDMSQLQWLIDKLYAEPYRKYEIFPLDGTDYPTQALVNEYVETQNISSHFDDFDAFGPVIATISMCSPIYMTLKKPREKTNACQDILEETKLILEPRSLLVMKEDARYEFRHGIPRAKLIHMPDGTILRRDEKYRRVSITIRKLLEGRKRVQIKDAELTFGQSSFQWENKSVESETKEIHWKDYHSWRRSKDEAN